MDISVGPVTLVTVLLLRALTVKAYELLEEDVFQNESAEKCTLAVPTVTLTEEGYTVDIEALEAEFNENDIVWTGYTEKYHSFQYRGCNRLKDVRYTQEFNMNGDVGTCYSACATNYIGIGRKGKLRVCLCIETAPMFETKEECTEMCSHLLCGGKGVMSIYQHLGENDEQPFDEDSNCLAYSPYHELYWHSCLENYVVMCEVQGQISGIQLNGFDWFKTWSQTMELCFEENQFPPIARHIVNENPWTNRWTGQVRSLVLTVNRRNPTGYLVKQGNTFILHFRSAAYSGRPLCGVYSTVNDKVSIFSVHETETVVTEHPNTSDDEPASTTADAQYTLTSHTKPTNAATKRPLNLSTEDDDTVVYLYVIIPLSLILIVVIIVVILLWRRKRRANAEDGRKEESMEMKKPRLRTVGNAIYETGVIESSLMATRQPSNQPRAESPGIHEHDGVYQNTQVDQHAEAAMITVNTSSLDADETEYDTTLAGNGINQHRMGETDNVYNKLEVDDGDTYEDSGVSAHVPDPGDDTYNHLGDSAESNYELAGVPSTMERMLPPEDVYSKASSY